MVIHTGPAPFTFHNILTAMLAAHCRYIKDFQSGFDEGLDQVQLSFMQSDGGLSPVTSFSGHKAILSGPAGGCAICLDCASKPVQRACWQQLHMSR